jgi:hypothetical protein
MDRKLAGPQNRCGLSDDETNIYTIDLLTIHNFITCTLHRIFYTEYEMGVACRTNGRDGKYIYTTVFTKCEGMSLFERPRRTWEDNIRTDLWVVRCGLDSYDTG